MALPKSDQDLLAWADCLIRYAEDWDVHFKPYGKFFTQEYWYLLVGVTRGYWQGAPLNVAAAKNAMHGMDGHDDRAKDARIEEAVQAELIDKRPYKTLDGELKAKFPKIDTRSTLLLPTPKLEAAMRSHLAATRTMAIATLIGKPP